MVTFNGRDHIRTPAVLLQEDILYYPNREHKRQFIHADCLKNSPPWDGTSIVLDHPKKRGVPVSAQRKDVLEQRGMGVVKNDRVESKKLKADLLIDVEKSQQMNQYSNEIVQAIMNDKTVEISTGYFAKALPEPHPQHEKMEYQGKKYDAYQRNHRPDHLAMLTRTKGRCSVEDGCGAPRVNSDSEIIVPEGAEKIMNGEADEDDLDEKPNEDPGDTPTVNVLSTSRTESDLIFDGEETRAQQPWGEVSKDLEDYIDAWFSFTDASREDFEGELTEVDELPQPAKQWISQHTLLGDSQADNVRDLIFFPVVNPNNNNLNEGALRAIITQRGESANIPDQARVSAQGAARTMLEDVFNVDFQENEFLKENAMSTLVSLLRGQVTEMSGEDRTHRSVIQGMADAAGISYSMAREVLESELNDIPLEWLRAFMEELGLTPEEVAVAAQDDGRNITRMQLTENDGSETNDSDEGGVNMNEKLEAIANSTAPFTEEELKEFDEDKIDKLHDTYVNDSGDGEDPEEDPQTESGTEDEPATINQDQFDQMVANSLGCDDISEARNLVEIGREVKANQESQREALVTAIVDNSELWEDGDFENFDLQQIHKIHNEVTGGQRTQDPSQGGGQHANQRLRGLPDYQNKSQQEAGSDYHNNVDRSGIVLRPPADEE